MRIVKQADSFQNSRHVSSSQSEFDVGSGTEDEVRTFGALGKENKGGCPLQDQKLSEAAGSKRPNPAERRVKHVLHEMVKA